MLALPLQRASSANTVPLLKSFLTSTFGTGADLKFDRDLADFQRVRQNAIAVTQSSGESGLISLSVIIHQLKSMAPRLAEYQNDLHLLFNYQDAFLPTKNIQCTSLYYELSTFLWNFAALHSQVGSRIDRSTDDGIRTANKHFQVAAGALDWITDNCIPNLHEEVNFGPVKPPVLRMMSMLMLAQAQLCFYEKALRDKKAGLMKPGIVAKLAAQTALNYKSTVDMSKMSGCASYIDLSWSNHVEFQYKCFLAAAEFSQSQAAKEAAQNKGTGYGEEIARLIRATALVSSAIDFANRNKLGVSLTNGAAGLQRSIEAAKCIAENDNRRVYMEVVPADSTLAQIVPVAMAKPSTAPESAGTVSYYIVFSQPRKLYVS